MRSRAAVAAALGLMLATAACSSSSADGTALPSGAEPPAACARADADGVVEITADDLTFSAPCIVVPAGEAFIVRFTNHESLPHDVAIYSDRAKGTTYLEGDTIIGPDRTVDYPVDALVAGEYYFDCIVHPADMNGTLYSR